MVLGRAQDPPRREGGLLSNVIHKLEQQFVVCSLTSVVTLMEDLQGGFRHCHAWNCALQAMSFATVPHSC